MKNPLTIFMFGSNAAGTRTRERTGRFYLYFRLLSNYSLGMDFPKSREPSQVRLVWMLPWSASRIQNTFCWNHSSLAMGGV